MFDDLRQQAGNESSFDEEPIDGTGPKPALTALSGALGGFGINQPDGAPRYSVNSDLILGLNGPQRFVLSLLFFMMVVTLGVMLLFVTGRVVLPF